MPSTQEIHITGSALAEHTQALTEFEVLAATYPGLALQAFETYTTTRLPAAKVEAAAVTVVAAIFDTGADQYAVFDFRLEQAAISARTTWQLRNWATRYDAEAEGAAKTAWRRARISAYLSCNYLETTSYKRKSVS